MASVVHAGAVEGHPAGVVRLLTDSLLASAARAPEAPAIDFQDETLSYRELADRALRIGRVLQEEGVRRGDRVVVLMEPSPWVVAGVYGAGLAGAAFVVVNPQTKEDKLRYIVDDCRPSALLCDARLARRVGAALERSETQAGLELPVLTVGPVEATPGTHPTARRLEEALAGAEPAVAPAGTIPLDLAAIIYTSGSTGAPKGVMLSHLNMTFALQSVAEYLRLRASDRILNVLPLAFDYGLYQALMAVHVGATLVLETSFAFPAGVVQRIQDRGVSVLPGVPTIFATLLAMHRRTPLSLPSVRTITNTGAHLPGSYVEQLGAICPNAAVFKMYGLTECKRVCYLDPALLSERPASVGKAIPGTEVYVVDEAGVARSAGAEGILHVRGPHVMMGYWNLPEETAHMLVPGRYPGERALCTHDLFRIDDDGFLYFLGRTDDIIKSGGEKISPAEVENALATVPGVRQVAVTGVPDALLGQAVRAEVVLDEGVTMDEREFRRQCVRRLEGTMVPRDIVFSVHLPQTANGKVRKTDCGESHDHD